MLTWMHAWMKKLTLWDIGILKVCVMAFTLMVAKLWPPLLNLSWYCYGSVFIVTYVFLLNKVLRPTA